MTVPAYFNDTQRRATEDACTIAGLNCLKILNEPTAAAIAQGLHMSNVDSNVEKHILIFDFGGGTLDVTILRISQGSFKVLSTSGDCNLGGQDIDNALVRHFIEHHLRETREDLSNNTRAKAKLKK